MVVKVRVPRVYSYIRFSTKDQERGDSERRQITAHKEWAKRHNLPLDTSLEVDRGLSGYTGDNIDRGALGQFVLAVMRGDVARGSVLLVDTMDRFTRQDEQTAVYLLLTLTRAGVRIVRLSPTELIFDEASDLGTFLAVLVDVSRSHGESKTKSGMVAKAKAAARELARGGVKVRQRHPDWLRLKDGKFEEIPERAELVRRAWRLKADGLSYYAIAQTFNAEGLTTFRRKGRWSQASVYGLIGNRQAIGRYQPKDAGGSRMGEPIDDYYPAVVPKPVAVAALSVLAERNKLSGRVRRVVNLFAGLLREACVVNGELLARPHKMKGGAVWYALARDYQTPGPRPIRTLAYAPFERAILSRLVELNPADLEHDQGDDVDELTAALADVKARKARIAAAVARDPSDTLMDAARVVDGEMLDLTDRLEQAERRRLASPPDDLTACKELIRTLEAAPDAKTHRVRIRTRIRAIVERMDVVIADRRGDRLAVVQIGFKGGMRRDYLLGFRHGRNMPNGNRIPARSAVLSLAWQPADVGQTVDLTNVAHAEALKAWLAVLDVAALPWREDE